MERRHRDAISALERDGLTPEVRDGLDELDAQLHKAIIAGLQNPLVENIYRRVHDYLRILRLDRKQTEPLAMRFLQEHMAIIVACRRRKGGGSVSGTAGALSNALQRNMGLYRPLLIAEVAGERRNGRGGKPAVARLYRGQEWVNRAFPRCWRHVGLSSDFGRLGALPAARLGTHGLDELVLTADTGAGFATTVASPARLCEVTPVDIRGDLGIRANAYGKAAGGADGNFRTQSRLRGPQSA